MAWNRYKNALKKVGLKISGALLSVGMSAAIFTGCGANSSGAATGNGAGATQQNQTADVDPYAVPEGELQELSVKADAEHVKALGRAYYENSSESLWMTFSATGAEFEFYGTEASISFYGDNTAMKMGGDKNSQARVAVYVNGERVLDEMLNQMESTFSVYTAQEPEWVTVKVVKLSESANSTCGIKAINVKAIGDVRPTQEKDYLVEIIGDSITCGYGVDDEVKENHFSTITEDATKTYGYIAAETLGIDYSLVSFSGFGVLSGYTSNGEGPNTVGTLPQYYDKIGMSYVGYRSFMAADFEWSFTRQPDVVVINLGTNDSSYTGSDAGKKADFEASYVEFLRLIRSKNPNATILCTLGIMGDNLCANIENAAKTYTEETGDSNIRTMRFDVQSASDGYAADWHPTHATHKKAAEKLAAELKAILGI